MHILVTGGSGYIGSHTCLELLNKAFDVTVIDNLSNSSRESIRRVEGITGKKLPFHEIDLCDKSAVNQIFDDNNFNAVIHFAGYKAVGDSVVEPLNYYRNNLDSTLTLCEVMKAHGVRKLIFSSSAAVYGLTDIVPTPETVSTQATSPYGQTKAMIEQILTDLAISGRQAKASNHSGQQISPASRNGWQISLLRYFNPIGAHPSGRIGDDPKGVPNGLLPYISQVAVGKLPQLTVYGGDYDTPDSTGVRDYIHVVDLALGHIAALEHLPSENSCEAYNLGSGKGSSVLDIVKAFEAASGKSVPYKLVGRRPGDVVVSLADPTKANHVLNWRTTRTVEQACADAWRWQSQNPNGYSGVK